MDRTTYRFAPGILLDARRALWLEEERTLVVADLHLGYAWAHRHSGQMLPLSMPEDTADRLEELVRRYSPRELVLLGDIVHRAVPVPAFVDELKSLFAGIGAAVSLCVVAGNHDNHLPALLAKLDLPIALRAKHCAGPHLLVHGDDATETTALLAAAETAGSKVIIGHEHPAFCLTDRVTTRLKCPCFLVSPQMIVLPAFSRWAAGTVYQRGRALSPFLHACPPSQVVPIVGDRLLPPLPLR